jgi:hypothetical protein
MTATVSWLAGESPALDVYAGTIRRECNPVGNAYRASRTEPFRERQDWDDGLRDLDQVGYLLNGEPRAATS